MKTDQTSKVLSIEGPEDLLTLLKLCDRAIDDLTKSVNGLADWRNVNAARFAIQDWIEKLDDEGGNHGPVA